MSTNRMLVIGEPFNGQLRPVTRELVAAARIVADTRDAEVILAVPGAGVTDLAADAARIAGVDLVVTVEHEALAPFLAGPWTAAVADLVRQLDPFLVLVPSSITGRDYATRVAARLGLAMVSDAIGLAASPDGLVATRAVFGARTLTDVTVADDVPALFTVAPGAFKASGEVQETAPIEALTVSIAESDQRVRLVSSADHTGGPKGITEAERIVSGGRGLGKPENFALVEELAAAMNAAVGASGATVGMGWKPHSIQVGSTGHSVSPALYVAVGISGAPQHLVGMAGTEWVVAINRDPQAPIFTVADFGIVGDLFEVVPALTRQLQS